MMDEKVIIVCKGCGKQCDCYENNYPYRKDRYPTEEYDGYGERLGDDYDDFI
jgi:hypothetical protein